MKEVKHEDEGKDKANKGNAESIRRAAQETNSKCLLNGFSIGRSASENVVQLSKLCQPCYANSAYIITDLRISYIFLQNRIRPIKKCLYCKTKNRNKFVST